MPLASHGKSRQSLFGVGGLGVLLSGLMLYLSLNSEGIPPRTRLQEAAGTVEWVRDQKYALHFKLRESDLLFAYLKKGNASDVVKRALSQGTDAPLVVLYDPLDSSGPIYDADSYHGIYELVAGGAMVRSHAEVAAAWRADDALAPWLAAAFLVSGIFLIVTALRTPR